MSEPLWGYEIAIHPQTVREDLLYVARRLNSASVIETEMCKRLATIIDATHSAYAIPAVRKEPEPVVHQTKVTIGGEAQTQVEDMVNHPSHYTAYKGIEVIQLTEQMNFNRGNAVKYVARAGLKNKATEVQDLQKAVWYLNREIERIQND